MLFITSTSGTLKFILQHTVKVQHHNQQIKGHFREVLLSQSLSMYSRN